MTLRGVLLSGLAWVIYSLLGTLPLMSSAHVSFGIALLGQLTQSFFLGAVSVVPWLVVIRWMDGRQWVWIIAVHALLTPAYAATAYLLYTSYLNLISVYAAQTVSTAAQWMLFSYATLYLLQFAVYHGIQIMARLRQKEKEALELTVLSREQELAALKSQINPHFLFNTLNSISAVASRDAEETRTMIAELGDLFRYATEMSKRDLVPLREELEFTRSYLDLESKRLGDRLQIKLNVAVEAAQCRIPPLILQPLVENAIKHGIEPSETGGVLSIYAELIDGRLAMRVADTGVGYRPVSRSDGSGIGLRNTDLRLRKLFGEGAGLRTGTPEGGGFEVSFSIPFDTREA